VGGDGVGKVDVALRFIGLRVQCRVVLPSDSVTLSPETAFTSHTLLATTLLRVAFAEAHPVTL
jgi:hypothetical protein